MASARSLLTASVLVTLYYVLPLDTRATDRSALAQLALGGLVFVLLMAWQIRAIPNSETPALKALEGLFVALPLFLLIFSSVYFLMARSGAENFTAPLTRTDALYFTVTIFSTVGFGDINAQTESARLVVTAQMMLDLIILGIGVRIVLAAVQRGRERLADESEDDH